MLKKIKIQFKYFIFKFRKRHCKGLQCEDSSCIKLDLQLAVNSKLLFKKGAAIGTNCCIRIRENASVVIGENFGFNNNCILIARERINIGNNVMCGPGTLIIDNDHDFRSVDYMNNYITSPIIIEDNVWIGANVTVLRGSHIKAGAVIGAGTVVKGVVEEHSVYYNKTNLVTYKY